MREVAPAPEREPWRFPDGELVRISRPARRSRRPFVLGFIAGAIAGVLWVLVA